LGLIVLVTQANDPSFRSASLVKNDARGGNCGTGYVPSTSTKGFGCGGATRNTIQGGKLTVGTSF
jgi:hypothetical protein